MVSLFLSVLLSSRSFAQQQEEILHPPEVSYVDDHGVDLLNLTFTTSTTEVVIGPPDAGGLSFTRTHLPNGSWQHSHYGVVSIPRGPWAGLVPVTVSIGDRTETFYATSLVGPYAPQTPRGSSLTGGVSGFTYTFPDGTIATFGTFTDVLYTHVYQGAMLTSITRPNGEVLNYHYHQETFVFDGGGVYPNAEYTEYRLQAVTNNFGYQLHFEYASNTASAGYEAWSQISAVRGINMAVEYCDPSAISCSGVSSSWPRIT